MSLALPIREKTRDAIRALGNECRNLATDEGIEAGMIRYRSGLTELLDSRRADLIISRQAHVFVPIADPEASEKAFQAVERQTGEKF